MKTSNPSHHSSPPLESRVMLFKLLYLFLQVFTFYFSNSKQMLPLNVSALEIIYLLFIDFCLLPLPLKYFSSPISTFIQPSQVLAIQYTLFILLKLSIYYSQPNQVMHSDCMLIVQLFGFPGISNCFYL